MSSNNTIWKKKFNSNINNITEGLENERNHKDKDKDKDKDKEQHKVLDEIKRKLETMANKRKGFTKLPHLEGLNDNKNNNSDTKTEDKDTINKDKSDTKNDVSIKEGNTSEETSGKINLSAIGLGIGYMLFLLSYLQFYHLNFKNDFEDFNTKDENNNQPLPTKETVTKEILDSLRKTLGKSPYDPEYTNIKNNNFLKALNTFACFDGGVILRYILIPAQLIVIFLNGFIPNAHLFLSKTNFTIMFFTIFGLIFASIATTEYTDINDIRNVDINEILKKDVNKDDVSWWHTFIDWGGWKAIKENYYKFIPTSYFIVIGIIIVSAFGLDLVKQMRTSEFWKGGLFGVTFVILFQLFTMSLSLVLSGFSLIPVALYLLWWIIDPDPEFRYGLKIPIKWQKVLMDSYWLPENDLCDTNRFSRYAKIFSRKLWNNKILLLTIFIVDVMIVMSHTLGREDLEKWGDFPKWYVVHVILGFILIVSLILETSKIQDSIEGIILYIKSFNNQNNDNDNNAFRPPDDNDNNNYI